ncbi:MAG: hypothetical protein M1405_02775 [Patescibacteria group bacterium]|nr:hypothetical protein [Patescibacteria group bacterium]
MQKARAASLTSVSDTITTSRPSASAPLTSNQAASAGQVTINDNGSIFLASDSAVLWPDTGETLNTVNVASMSAANTPSSNQRIVYFTNTAANTHHAGDPITTAITTTHKIQFTTISTVPASGKIVLTFPGTAVTTASPSATTFSFNGLTTANSASNISYKLDGTRTCTFAIATSGQTPTITCTVDAGGSVVGGTVITFLIGCADSSSNETSCTTNSPRLINPTKSAAAGTADNWKISIQTQDNNSVTLDSAKATIGTIESVQVQATVDPTLTFTIAPVSGAINTGNTTGCTNTESVNSGIASTATTINLGILNTSTINISAQLITISTNASGGYTLTATSSGHLVNPATGIWIPDSTTPTAMTINVPWFGIHPCGLNVTSIWYTTTRNDATGGGTGAKYGWPTQSTAVTLASASTGPIGNTAATGGVGAGLTSVEYAGAVDVTIPAGTYYSVVTYVATATF